MTDTARKHRSAITLAVIVGGLVTLASLTQHTDGPRQLTASEAEYCEMTAMWQEDAKAGFAESQRRGWPDFHRNAASLCPLRLRMVSSLPVADRTSPHGQQVVPVGLRA